MKFINVLFRSFQKAVQIANSLCHCPRLKPTYRKRTVVFIWFMQLHMLFSTLWISILHVNVIFVYVTFVCTSIASSSVTFFFFSSCKRTCFSTFCEVFVFVTLINTWPSFQFSERTGITVRQKTASLKARSKVKERLWLEMNVSSS